MRNRKLLPKFLALFVTATVALPNFAFALRPMLDKAGLEEALAPKAAPLTTSGMEESPLEIEFEPTSFAKSYLQPHQIKQFLDVAAAAERGGYDAPSGGRGVLIRLPPQERRMVTIPGLQVPMNTIKLVGVASIDKEGRVIRPQTQTRYEEYGSSTLEIAWNDAGLLATQLGEPHFAGIVVASKAANEIEVGQYLLERGIPTAIPLGSGKYPALVAGNTVSGFKALGLPNSDDVRFDQQKPGLAQIKHLGRTLRAVHDGGFDSRDSSTGVIHRSPHDGNFALVNVDGTEHVFVHDLEIARRKTAFRTVHELLGEQYLDLLRARNSIIQDFGIEGEAAFLQGYFYDRWDSINPEQLDWGLIRWTGWKFFGEATRTPFGWIDSPIVHLLMEINSISIPPAPDWVKPTQKTLSNVIETAAPEWAAAHRTVQGVSTSFRGELVVPVIDASAEIHNDLPLLRATQGSPIPPVRIEQVPSVDWEDWLDGVLLSYARANFDGHLGIILGILPRSLGEEAGSFLQQRIQELEKEFPQYKTGWEQMRGRISLIWTPMEDLQPSEKPRGRASALLGWASKFLGIAQPSPIQRSKVSYVHWADSWIQRAGQPSIQVSPLSYPDTTWKRLEEIHAGLEEGGGLSAITVRQMTVPQLRARYGLGQTSLPSDKAFVIATAQVASQIWFYYMHDTVEPGLARLMANQRDILPKGIELALVAAPASPDQLRRPGGMFVDRWLPKRYEQFVFPEIPVTLGEPLPSLPSLILWILRGAGGEILEVRGVLKLEENVYAYFV